MKTDSYKLEQGFTAIELLITLFIASIFLFAGYQLFTQVMKDGTSANKTAQLSSIVYDRMRKAALTASSAAPGGCAASSESVTGPAVENIAGIGNVTFTTTVDCPYSTTPGNLTDIFLIDVKASFSDNGATRTVEHATFTS